jgi:hypothetical protein
MRPEHLTTIVRQFRRLALSGLGAAALASLVPAVAAAGTYNVYVCPGQGGANNAMGFSGSTNHISDSQWCNGEGSGRGLQVWSNNSASGAQAGGWWFNAPAGTTIVGLSSTGQFSAFDGWVSNWATDMNGSGDPYGGTIDCPSTYCNSAAYSDYYASVPNATVIGFGIWCHSSSCPASAAPGQSWFGPAGSANVYDATITINDPNPPGFPGDSGSLLSPHPVWISDANAPGGGWSLQSTATDPGGVCGIEVSIGGEQATGGNGADFTRAVPCGGNASATLNLNPCALGDGSYSISESASNPAGMTGYGPSNGQTVNIDCSPPSTGIASAPSPSRWYSGPQQVVFAASDNLSGVAYLNCNDGQHSGAAYTETVSGQGTSTVSCQAVDNASNVGNTASATVNIDPQVPTVAFSGASSSGWVSGAQTITVTGGEAQTLSGIASTACAVDGAAATTTSGATQTLTISTNGTHTITCTATTGAGVTSQPTSFTVNIDSTPPTLQYSDAPPQAQWTSAPQTITATATAPPGLAGVSEIQCTLAGQTTTYPGASVQITVQPPGGQLICRAQDNAGNWSTSEAWQFLIDDTAPTGQFLPGTASNPALVQARLSDTGSGVAGARIEIQTSSGWQQLASTWDESSGVVSAAIPDDGSIADGSHQLEVLVWDAAGNQATITEGPGGAPDLVTLPLRVLTKLKVNASLVLTQKCTTRAVKTRKPKTHTAGTHQRKRRHHARRVSSNRRVKTCRLLPVAHASRDLRYGQEQTVHGILTTADGSPIADATVLVLGRAHGWRSHPLGTTTTDSAGRFSYAIEGIATETVTFTYQGTNTLRQTIGRTTVRVVGRARLHVARRAIAGRTLRISGRVLGGYIPAGGVLVQLRYRVRGVPIGWAPFHQAIHTNRSGRFSVEFPLNKAARRYTYMFDAVIEQQNGWPFLTTTTNAVARYIYSSHRRR